MTYKIFVIIVTHNGTLWYERCFNSLRLSTLPVHTVVVDNASTDDTANYITSNFPEIQLIQSEVNLGFGQGNNKGIRYAVENGANYVFLLNQDAWIEQDTIEQLVDISKRHPEYGILSPLHLNASKTGIEEGLMHYIADYKTTSPQFIEDLYFQRLSEIYPTNYVNAAAWLLPRNTLEIVGGFDPIFFHYGEDDNYMQRVRFHKMKIGLCPLVTICHDTERREIKKHFKNISSLTCLLVKLADINAKSSSRHFILFSIRKAIQKALKLKLKETSILFIQASFVFRVRKRIHASKVQNKKRVSSWLN
ncbi:MAG: glycosyl transferase family 2 [Bacteroidetes bacterium]|nr:glycosyl transferase family 2 [Bacteroidota bacterium]